MKRIIRAFLVVFTAAMLTVLSITNIFAATIIQIDSYLLKVEDNNTTALYGWTGSDVNLSVPLSLDNYYISSIEDYAFENDGHILNLDLSKATTLRSIGIMSFKGCSNLSGTVTVPTRVNEIGMGAFQECTSITSAVLYSGSRTVPAQMFYGCTQLSEVTIGYGFTSIDKLAFGNCTKLKTVTIPQTVTSIDSTAFNNIENFTIKCYNNSYAQQFAIDNGIDYDIINPLLGDVDGDGVVNINDVTYIQLYRVDLISLDVIALKRADVNKDNNVTLRDATMIQMKLANLITTF